MEITLIAAVSDDGFVSAGKGIPWHLPDDIAHFRAFTMGKHLLVGGSTFDEMAAWFKPEHTVYVLGRERPVMNGHVRFFSTLESIVRQTAEETGDLVVIGGSSVYEQTFPLATRLVITHVHTRLGQGKPFPTILQPPWQVLERLDHAADDRHAFAFSIVTYSTSVLRG